MHSNVMFPNRSNPIVKPNALLVGSTSLPLTDPLHRSKRDTLPFPHQAASALAEQRGKRYDDLEYPAEDFECRIRELAPIMGLFGTNEDLPTAA